MIRGTLLDKSIYREAAANLALQNEAQKVLAVVVMVGSAGALLFSFSMQGLRLFAGAAIAQAGLWLLRVWAIQLASTHWLKKPIPFDVWFRAITYAQCGLRLGVIPRLAPLLMIWSLITSAAVVQDLLGVDTSTAAIVSVIGGVAVLAAAPLIVGLF
jgi:hypothetical protein